MRNDDISLEVAEEALRRLVEVTEFRDGTQSWALFHLRRLAMSREELEEHTRRWDKAFESQRKYFRENPVNTQDKPYPPPDPNHRGPGVTTGASLQDFPVLRTHEPSESEKLEQQMRESALRNCVQW
ncbi:MAG TPA: hypothetical protein VKV39_06665 [Candidatus Sulfotelmatobacter sp.]|nr:hypothetical protein [Candidatus Sulfotelmatobacter sp.]